MGENKTIVDRQLSGNRIRNTLLWVGAVSAVSAVAALIVVRATVVRDPADPTSERIQVLIDEANQLLKSINPSEQG